MKRKITTLLAILSMTTLVTSCGSSIASAKALSVANQVVQVTEDYLDGNIDGDEAFEQINGFYDDLDYVENYTYEEKRDDTQKKADYSIRLNILILSTSVLIDKDSGNADTYDDVQEKLGTLKESIKEYD